MEILFFVTFYFRAHYTYINDSFHTISHYRLPIKNNQAIIVLQSDSEDVWEDIERLQRDVTNIRIHIGNGSRNPHHN